MLYADEYIGRLTNQLAELGIDEKTTHIPMILSWPGLDQLNGRQFDAFHYQVDISATILEMLEVKAPARLRNTGRSTYADALEETFGDER